MEDKYSEIQAKYANWQLKASKKTPETENSGEKHSHQLTCNYSA